MAGATRTAGAVTFDVAINACVPKPASAESETIPAMRSALVFVAKSTFMRPGATFEVPPERLAFETEC